MITNEKIEQQLKDNRMWYKTNNYFLATIMELDNQHNVIASSSKTRNKYLINSTETEVLVIPLNPENTNELLPNQAITICIGDISIVRVSVKSSIYTTLRVEQKNGTVLSMDVDLGYDFNQRRSIVKFVESFKNEGSQFLFRENSRNMYSTNTSSVSNDTSSNVGLIIAIPIMFIVVMANVSAFLEALDIDEEVSVFVYIIAAVVTLIVSIKMFTESNKKSKSPINKVNRPDFQNMTQEQREEAREKYHEDILTSSGPIVSEDKDYGGIKKL